MRVPVSLRSIDSRRGPMDILHLRNILLILHSPPPKLTEPLLIWDIIYGPSLLLPGPDLNDVTFINRVSGIGLMSPAFSSARDYDWVARPPACAVNRTLPAMAGTSADGWRRSLRWRSHNSFFAERTGRSLARCKIGLENLLHASQLSHLHHKSIETKHGM